MRQLFPGVRRAWLLALALVLAGPVASARSVEDPEIPQLPEVPALPSADPKEVEQFVESVLELGEDTTRAPCVSVALGPASEHLDAKTYLGEQTLGLELNGALPLVSGVNAVVVTYPVACQNWVEDLIAHDQQEYAELVAPLLP